MQKHKIHKISLAAIFTALIFTATYFIAIPMPAGIGFVNLGDAFVLLGAWILGPLGCICAGVGSALADLLLGYAVYAPATLVIKALMVFVGYYSFKVISSLLKRPVGFIISSVLAELLMVIGYFVFEWILYGFALAIANIAFNLIQGLCAIVASNVIINILFANKAIARYINNLKQ